MVNPRSALALVFAAWIVGWPLVHVALVAWRDLNPWKLGGWGMYSDVLPYDLGLKAFVLAEGAELPSDLGRVLGSAQVMLLDPAGDSELVLGELPLDQLVALADHSRDVRVLGSRSGMRDFFAHLGELAEPRLSAPPESIVLLITKPRVDPARRLSYVETAAYHFRPETDSLVPAGEFRSDRSDEEAVAERLRAIVSGEPAGRVDLEPARTAELPQRLEETG